MKSLSKLLILFLFFCRLSFSQTPSDSTYKLINALPNDTTKVIKLLDLAWSVRASNFTLAITSLEQGLQISNSVNYKNGIARAKCRLGSVYNTNNEADSAMKYGNEALDLFFKLKDTTWIIACYKNISNVLLKKGDYIKALSSCFKGLKLAEACNNKKLISNCLAGISVVYYHQKNYSKSIECYKRNLKILAEIKDSVLQCQTLNNLAGLLYETKKDKEALQTTQEAFAIGLKLGLKKELINSYIITANIYSDGGDNKKAESYYLKAIALEKEIGDMDGLLITLFNIADIYAIQGQSAKALEYKLEALKIAVEIEEAFRVQEAYQGIALLYSQMGNFKEAYQYNVLYSNLKDSLLNSDNNRQIAEMNTKYETEKKDKELIKKDAELTIQSAIAQKQAMQRNYFVVGFIIVAIFALFILRSFRQKQKANKIITQQKELVEKQKHIVEEKQKEILDSIHYAKRIQTALITNEKYIAKSLERLSNKN